MATRIGVPTLMRWPQELALGQWWSRDGGMSLVDGSLWVFGDSARYNQQSAQTAVNPNNPFPSRNETTGADLTGDGTSQWGSTYRTGEALLGLTAGSGIEHNAWYPGLNPDGEGASGNSDLFPYNHNGIVHPSVEVRSGNLSKLWITNGTSWFKQKHVDRFVTKQGFVPADLQDDTQVAAVTDGGAAITLTKPLLSGTNNTDIGICVDARRRWPNGIVKCFNGDIVISYTQQRIGQEGASFTLITNGYLRAGVLHDFNDGINWQCVREEFSGPGNAPELWVTHSATVDSSSPYYGSQIQRRVSDPTVVPWAGGNVGGFGPPGPQYPSFEMNFQWGGLESWLVAGNFTQMALYRATRTSVLQRWDLVPWVLIASWTDGDFNGAGSTPWPHRIDANNVRVTYHRKLTPQKTSHIVYEDWRLASAPVVSAFTATPSSLGNAGGSVALAVSATDATSYTYSVSPALPGLPVTQAGASLTVSLPGNAGTTPKVYTFSVTAIGPGGSTVSTIHPTVTVDPTPPAPQVPSPPTGLLIDTFTDVSMSLKWNQNPEPDITGYVVYRQSGASWVQVATTVPSERSAIVSGLTPSTEYTFAVTAVNAVGESARSLTATETTAAAPPVQPDPPTNLDAQDVTADHVVLIWDAVAGAIEYAVFQLVDANWVQVALTPTTTATIGPLSANTEYTFAVTARSADLESERSDPFTVTTIGVPEPPRPEPPDRTVTNVFEGRALRPFLLGTATQTVEPDLAPFAVSHHLIVRSSNPRAARAGLPTAVMGLHVEQLQPNSLDLVWTPNPPEENVTQYVIEVRGEPGAAQPFFPLFADADDVGPHFGSTTEAGWTTLGLATGARFSITGLSPSTGYAYRVSAQNGAGVGPSSQIAVTTPPTGPALPPPPSGIRAVAVTDKRIDVTWTAVAGVSQYSVTYREASAGGWVTKRTSIPSIALTGLVADTRYEIQVASVSGSGLVGSYSASVFQTTKDAPTPPTNLPPAMPRNLRVLTRDRTSITLIWDANGEPDLAGYYVQRFVKGSGTYTRTVVMPRTFHFNDGDVVNDDTGTHDMTDAWVRFINSQLDGADVNHMLRILVNPTRLNGQRAVYRIDGGVNGELEVRRSNIFIDLGGSAAGLGLDGAKLVQKNSTGPTVRSPSANPPSFVVTQHDGAYWVQYKPGVGDPTVTDKRAWTTLEAAKQMRDTLNRNRCMFVFSGTHIKLANGEMVGSYDGTAYNDSYEQQDAVQCLGSKDCEVENMSIHAFWGNGVTAYESQEQVLSTRTPCVGVWVHDSHIWRFGRQVSSLSGPGGNYIIEDTEMGDTQRTLIDLEPTTGRIPAGQESTVEGVYILNAKITGDHGLGMLGCHPGVTRVRVDGANGQSPGTSGVCQSEKVVWENCVSNKSNPPHNLCAFGAAGDAENDNHTGRVFGGNFLLVRDCGGYTGAAGVSIGSQLVHHYKVDTPNGSFHNLSDTQMPEIEPKGTPLTSSDWTDSWLDGVNANGEKTLAVGPHALRDGAGWNDEGTAFDPAHQFKITGLVPGKSYDLRVIAYDTAGLQSIPATITASTLP